MFVGSSTASARGAMPAGTGGLRTLGRRLGSASLSFSLFFSFLRAVGLLLARVRHRAHARDLRGLGGLLAPRHDSVVPAFSHVGKFGGIADVQERNASRH